MNLEVNNNLVSKDKLKDVLFTRTAMKTLQPISVIEKVISFTFKSATEALKTHRDVEVSGFGVFKTNDFRAHQLIQKKLGQIQKIENKIIKYNYTGSTLENYQKTIEKHKHDIECIKLKLNNQTENTEKNED